jgi:hypothetical protein
MEQVGLECLREPAMLHDRMPFTIVVFEPLFLPWGFSQWRWIRWRLIRRLPVAAREPERRAITNRHLDMIGGGNLTIHRPDLYPGGLEFLAEAVPEPFDHLIVVQIVFLCALTHTFPLLYSQSKFLERRV